MNNEEAINKIDSVCQKMLNQLEKELKNVILRQYLSKIEFVVEYEPTEEQKKACGKNDLSGMFYDKPLGKPATIFLFARHILAWGNTQEKLEKEVRRVLLHEIGHYMGMDHKQLSFYDLNTSEDK